MMPTRMMWLRRALFLFAVAALLSATTALAKKPPPEDPPPPTPTISYEITELGTLGGPASSALGLNAHGDVVGFADITAGGDRAFVYTTETGMVNLNSLLPANSEWVLTWAGDINDSGQIVGAGIRDGAYSAYRFTPTYVDGEPVYLDANGDPVLGIIEDLGTLGYPWAEATAINNNGDVVGAADKVGQIQCAFIWTEADGMEEIVGEYATTRANDLNELGEVVGNIRVGDVIHAFRCLAPEFEVVDLGYIKKARGGTSLGWGYGLNDSGQATGTASAGGSSVHAFRYTDDVGMEDLGTLDEDESSHGKAINAHGHVVGTSGPAQSGGFIFTEETGMLELWPLIVGPPEDLQENDLEPLDINDVGQVCGNARLLIPPDKSALRAVLLTPIVD